MKKVNEKLSEVFDVEPIDFTETAITPVKPTEIVSVDNGTVEDDANFARNNIKTLIEKGNQAMDGLLQVARESEHPRAYEVAAGLIKNLSDLNKDLLEIQKRKKDLNPESVNNAKNINVDKAVFVGSTTELVKFLKNNK